MADYQKTQGVILKRENIGEYDRRIVFYAQDLGKISALARSARKAKSKLAPHLELFNLVDLTLANRTIIGAQTVNDFEHLRDNLEKLETAQKIADLVVEFTIQGQIDKQVFDLLVAVFKDPQGPNIELFKEQFLVLLGFSGARPKNYKNFLRNNLT